ncbi:succinyl-CoA synthetase beta subunit [Methanococcus voltae]|uniref:ADP-forming succinate--CoA ligase subunit beta n=1 Tax=Methanococcus voltae TaxID=2188 RepID=UPI001AE986DD|nr:ADP-forming succinate--CoA ligase subunit beta [Methanococcus voltae]MBP2142887.1 succinyl-CoA synthetase beta subunit [Methanococcus voltae]
MKLHEYEAKAIFKSYGIPVPNSKVTDKKIENIDNPVVVKAQVLVGGRGKAGGILFANNTQEANEKIEELLNKDIKGETVEKVLLEDMINIEKEYYVGIVIDRNNKQAVVMFSTEGGVDIEQVAEKSPEKIIKYYVDFDKEFQPYMARNMLIRAGIPSKEISKIATIISKLYKAFEDMDGSLIEINPLVVTKEETIIAADAVFNLDDDSYYKHDFAKFEEYSKQEKSEFAYVDLDGDIAVIGNGAGLTLASMDIVKNSGGEPSCFLDVGGGSNSETVQKALRRALSKEGIKGVFINILGGITRCDEVSKGIVEVYKDYPNVKFAVRLMGTNEEEGRRILNENGISFETTMDNAAKKLMEIIQSE